MEVTYHHSWSKETIEAWLESHCCDKKTIDQYDDGYTIHFEGGDVWECVYGSRYYDTPTNCFINGVLAQSTLH